MKAPTIAPTLCHGSLALLLAATLSGQVSQFRDVTRMPLPTDANPTFKMAVGDFNGDGALDLVFGNMGGSLPGTQNTLYLNDGTGRFTDVTATNLPKVVNWTGSVAVGDVDGDKDVDIVFGNRSGNSQLLLNDGKGKFTDGGKRFTSPAQTIYCCRLVELNGKTGLDLVMRGHIFMNNGLPTILQKFVDVSTTHSVNTSYGPWGMAAGDIDGDGDNDLIFGDTSASTPMQLWLNDGTGKFKLGASNLPTTGVPIYGDFGLGDVDGDKDLDLYVSAYNQPDQLWLNDGKGKFTASSGKLPNNTTGLKYESQLHDIDNDGDLDAVVFHGANGANQTRIYLNDGQGKFTDATSRLPKLNARTVCGAVADLDVDGDMDILLSNWNAQDVLWTNFHRQINAPTQAKIGNTYKMEIFSQPGYATKPAVSLHAVGAAQAQPRIQLGSLGSLGIAQFVRLPNIPIAAPAGTTSWSAPVPNVQSLVGVKLFFQSAIFDTGSGFTFLTNVFPEEIGK